MFFEIAVGIVVLVAVVSVAFIVPVLLQLRKTAQEAERLFRRLNEDLPVLFREATQAIQNLNQVAAELREGVARARVLGEAMGEVGQTIHSVNGVVRSGTGSVLMNAGRVLAGFRAAFEVLKKG
jgi:uncharacterized protein YoxC